MPADIAIIKRLDKANESAANIRGTGNTSYIWESFENDIQLDRLNGLITLDGTDKLAQMMMKIILTPKGSEPDDLNYGTDMQTVVGEKFDSGQYAHVQSEVISALVHLNQINADNPNSDEVIETIDNVSTVADADDPRAMRIVISVTTESGKGVSVSAPQIVG